MIPLAPIPGTFFEWEDLSGITTPEINTVANMPLFCSVFTSDKGKEGWQRLSGQDWFDMYAVNNVVNFDKHGQPLLQTAMAINAGAEMLCKRVVADDAYLANIAVVANVLTSETQKVNEAGEPLYTDAVSGEETTVAEGNEPIMESKTVIKYSYLSAAGCATKAEVVEAIQESIETMTTDDGSTNYPLWIVTDNGRGTSKKRIRIIPNYQLSKNYEDYFLYDVQIIEGNNYFGNIHFCLNPDTIASGSNISFQYKIDTESNQVEAYQFDSEIKKFMDAITAASGLTTAEAVKMDLIFAKNKKGKALSENITVDTEGGVDLNIFTGQLLLNGENGAFGDNPVNAAGYGAQLAKAFAGYVLANEANPNRYTILTKEDGCYDPIIYNVDRYKIDAIFDANYPDVTKRAIEQLVTFREDCMYFRDMGTKCNTMDLIINADFYNLHDKFCATYCTYYDVLDPYSKKQVTVTMMYHFIQLAVSQFNTGRNMPMAGIRYGFVITDIVEDSIGFIPTICPDLNEKEELLDARINYATYIDNQLVIESLYTSQEAYSQLSFSNNILAVQQVIKVIRKSCPANRYTFIDGDDLSAYKAEVEGYIAPYESNFKKLELNYLEDPYYTENKIFYATLAVQFRDFVQTEYFKITALSSTEV